VEQRVFGRKYKVNLSLRVPGVVAVMTGHRSFRALPLALFAVALAPSARSQSFVRTPATQQLARAATGTGYSDMMLLTVDKTTLRAELKTWPEDWHKSTALRAFKIAIGKADGDKEFEGDNRTPEGIYFAQSHIDGSKLPEKYGKLAIPLDFPNPLDTIAGKTGHGIWLHGVDREGRVDESKVTEGCVAFYNTDIGRLSGWLKSHQGVIVISRDATAVNREADLSEVRQRTTAWLDAWAKRDVASYGTFYAPDFRFNQYDLKGYTDYKAKVFGSYKVMDVKFDSLRVITHPKYAVALFNQDFKGDDRFTSVGRKIVYWEKGQDGQWLIKREVFENRRFESIQFTDAELALISDPGSSMSSESEKKGPSL
jgi:murein L,D-transpeptidase YafK